MSSRLGSTVALLLISILNFTMVLFIAYKLKSHTDFLQLNFVIKFCKEETATKNGE
jgi:hypothetical protein